MGKKDPPPDGKRLKSRIFISDGGQRTGNVFKNGGAEKNHFFSDETTDDA
jgi:hypothetical protein